MRTTNVASATKGSTLPMLSLSTLGRQSERISSGLEIVEIELLAERDDFSARDHEGMQQCEATDAGGADGLGGNQDTVNGRIADDVRVFERHLEARVGADKCLDRLTNGGLAREGAERRDLDRLGCEQVHRR